jgi:hypothetical protein
MVGKICKHHRVWPYGNAYLTKLWGVLEGIRHVRHLNFRAVEVNLICIDSLVIVNNSTSNNSGKSLADRIRKLIDLEWEVVVHHFALKSFFYWTQTLFYIKK